MAADTQNEQVEDYPKKLRKPRREGGKGGLNINSMMDIMTILLVFLLVSITSDPLNVTQSNVLQLATSTADIDPKLSITVQIDRKQITVDQKDVGSVKIDCFTAGGQVCQEEDYANPDLKRSYKISKHFKKDGLDKEFLIQPLFERLEDLVKIAKEDHKRLEREGDWKGIVTIICDKEIPFRVVAEVVHTAAMTGLHRLRFAIVSTNTR